MNGAQCIADDTQQANVEHLPFFDGAPHFSASQVGYTPKKYGSVSRRTQGNPPNSGSLPNDASRLAVPTGCLAWGGTAVPERQSVMVLLALVMDQGPPSQYRTEPAK